MSNNSNTTAAAVSVKNFVNEVQNVEVIVDETYVLSNDDHFKYVVHSMKVGGVELSIGDKHANVDFIEKLNEIDENGKRLSTDEIETILYDEKSEFMNVPDAVFVEDYEKEIEENYAREQRVSEARARAQRAASGAAPVGTSTAAQAAGTATAAPQM